MDQYYNMVQGSSLHFDPIVTNNRNTHGQLESTSWGSEIAVSSPFDTRPEILIKIISTRYLFDLFDH
jgi:hypothetical protein